MPNKEDMLEPLPEETALQEQKDNESSPTQNFKDRALDETSKRAQQAMTSPKQNVPEPKQAKPPAGKPPTGAVAKGGAEKAVSQQATKQATATAARGLLKAAGPIGIALSLASDPRVQKILKYTLMGSIILVGTGVFMLGALAIGGVPNPKKGLSPHVDSKPGSAQVQSVAAKAGAADAQKLSQLSKLDSAKELVKKMEDDLVACTGNSCPYPLESVAELRTILPEATIAIENLTFLEPNSEQFNEEFENLKTILGRILLSARLITGVDAAQAFDTYTLPPNIEAYLKLARDSASPLAAPGNGERFNASSNVMNANGKPRRLNGYRFEAENDSKVFALQAGTVAKQEVWSDTSAALYVKSDTGNYTVIYGHIDPQVKEGDKVTRGQILGTVAPQTSTFPYLTIKVLSIDGRWIDWGPEPWTIRPSIEENDSDRTIAGGS